MKFEIEITSLAYGGRGIGRLEDGKVVFVPFTAPGDVAEVELTKEKGGFSEARLLSLKKKSPMRREPLCPVFTKCGGCQWQHIKYEEQVKWKGEIFKETLRRIGGVNLNSNPEGASPSAGVLMDAPLSAAEEFEYRSRAGFHIRDGKWGFFETSSNKIVEIDECPLLRPEINATFKELKDIGLSNFFHTVDIALDLSSQDEAKTVASFFSESRLGKRLKTDLVRAISKVKALKGFEINFRRRGARGQGQVLHTEGDVSTTYKIGSLTFTAETGVFTQVNPAQNENLVEKVLSYSELRERENLLDLFSGIGNLTLPLAKGAAHALGADIDGRAIKRAKENKKINDIVNADFTRCQAGGGKGAYEEVLKILAKEKPAVVILDPPRGGAPEATKAIVESAPLRVIYVSCNPATLARDSSVLIKGGYKLVKAGIIDLFPQTYHLEGVLSFVRCD